ncbi:MAG: hypothetical protein IH946_05550 [Bacteroidetes bacterium]|nr:hypothetical protein [Bacteroidota bacterium]
MVLKELRETLVCLRLISRTSKRVSVDALSELINECDQLVSIFVVSIRTAEKRLK